MSKPYTERLIAAQGIYAEGLRRVASTPIPKGQKFKPGTFVMINKDLGPSMSHFKADRLAMVQYTYAHAYGGSERETKSYSLLVRYDDGKWSSIAWYNEHQLTKVKDKELINKSLAEIEAQDE